MTAATMFKIVGRAGECLNGGTGAWDLPTADAPGEWREVAGEVVPCKNGLHLTTRQNLATWLPASGDAMVYRAEWSGQFVDAGSKVAVQSARLMPGPVDIGKYRRRLNAATIKARKVRDRALKGQPSAYLAAIGGFSAKTLPVGHPLRENAVAIRAAEDAYHAAAGKATAKYNADMARAIDRLGGRS